MLGGILRVSLEWRLVVVPDVTAFWRYDCI